MTIATFGAFYIGEFSEAVAVMIFMKLESYFRISPSIAPKIDQGAARHPARQRHGDP